MKSLAVIALLLSSTSAIRLYDNPPAAANATAPAAAPAAPAQNATATSFAAVKDDEKKAEDKGKGEKGGSKEPSAPEEEKKAPEEEKKGPEEEKKAPEEEKKAPLEEMKVDKRMAKQVKEVIRPLREQLVPGIVHAPKEMIRSVHEHAPARQYRPQEERMYVPPQEKKQWVGGPGSIQPIREMMPAQEAVPPTVHHHHRHHRVPGIEQVKEMVGGPGSLQPRREIKEMVGGPGSLQPRREMMIPDRIAPLQIEPELPTLNIKRVIRNHIENLLDKYSEDSSEKINLLKQLLDEESDKDNKNLDGDEKASGPNEVETQALSQWEQQAQYYNAPYYYDY